MGVASNVKIVHSIIPDPIANANHTGTGYIDERSTDSLLSVVLDEAHN